MKKFFYGVLALFASVSFAAPMSVPEAPPISAKAYFLMDYHTGKVLAHHQEHEHLAPASLTKMMTVYVAYQAIQQGKIKMDDPVHISEKAWRADGSRMFAEVNKEIPVADLLQGVIIQSGNDASIALAEHIAGSEESFVDLMNTYAQKLGMKDTHFRTATGLPMEDHYSSAYDLALLSQAIIRDFPPDLYALHSQKWFSYNGIKQPNRNRLLWRNAAVDGLKTGFTEAAGYCLAASAKKGDTRLIAVLLGADSDANRAEQTNKLITYGLRFYETHALFANNQPINQPRIWMGDEKTVPVGVPGGLFVTIPHGQYKHLVATMDLNKPIKAPIAKGTVVGSIHVRLENEEVTTQPLVALEDIHRAGPFSRAKDYVSMQATRVLKSGT